MGNINAQGYSVSMPVATHWDTATCEEFGCSHFLMGWQTVVPQGSEHERTVRTSGRSFREERTSDGQVRFTFSPGQPCFRASQHKVQSGRPAIYGHRNREMNGSVRAVRQDEWQERFAENLDGLARIEETKDA